MLGDLSGKGLAAAAQVSTVRNMLRAFLYSKLTVAEAVTELNRILTENNLLIDFSTLFVAAYDSGTRQLTYVNCGQEPALVRRSATGMVAPLSSTGPVLGSIENAQFDEETLTLAPGDALAIFSDGLTEVGLSRTTMLGAEGVTALFEKSDGRIIRGRCRGRRGRRRQRWLSIWHCASLQAWTRRLKAALCATMSVFWSPLSRLDRSIRIIK